MSKSYTEKRPYQIHSENRLLTPEEVEKWVKPYKPYIDEIISNFTTAGSATEMISNLFYTAYENEEIPYIIIAYINNSPMMPNKIIERYYTDCQEVILDWPPKKEEEPEDNRGIQIGAIVQHFKRETLTTEEKATNRYLYQIKEIAQHTETGEKLVVYQALYPPFATYARPADMFFSKVDKDKYPDIKQEYRLEKVEFPKEG